MNKAEIVKATHKLDSQGQIWRICCYQSETNRNKISYLGIKNENVIFLNLNAQNKEIIAALNKQKPDYLLIFETDSELLKLTSFIYEWGGKHYVLENDGYITSRKIESNIISIDKSIRFTYLQKKIKYDYIYEIKVDKYWDYLQNIGKKYFNGEMYSICNVIEDENHLEFLFKKTNYKHMIYSKEHDFRNDFHTCTTASIAIIETIDGYSVLGKMSNDSAFANQYKCIGGTLSENDISGTVVNIKSMFKRELMEEVGIDISNENICVSYLTKWLLIREKMAFVGVCNIIKLNMTKQDIQNHFVAFQETDKEKEVDELLFVKSFGDIKAIEEQSKADYVDELYGCYFSEKKCISWNQYKVKYNV